MSNPTSRACDARFFAIARVAIAAMTLTMAGANNAAAYIGESFLQVPGVAGGWPGKDHKDWVRAESNYWKSNPGMRVGAVDKLRFSGPHAPKKGPDMLAIAVDKHSPGLKALMEKCRSGSPIPEVKYAEVEELNRDINEAGPPPAGTPEFYEYVLKGVTLGCPVAEGAPEQAFTLNFQDIEWVNYTPHPVTTSTPEPGYIGSAPKSGKTKVFTVTWLYTPTNTNAADNDCAVDNEKPGEADYFAQIPKDKVAARRAELAKTQGGVSTNIMAARGPGELNVCLLPGIVPDPGYHYPRKLVTEGVNLDGDDGSGTPPPTTRKHQNYVSEDGRKGIDNQMYGLEACTQGYRSGGLFPANAAEALGTGIYTMLVEISGIDNEQNDNDVSVAVYYSKDANKRDAAGKNILANYTYRIADKPEFQQYFVRTHGRIVNGVIMTDTIPKLGLHFGLGGARTFYQAQFRLQIMPDGTLKGVLAGYMDWRRYLMQMLNLGAPVEVAVGFQCPALYDAVRRATDGLKDPVSGIFNGVSAGYRLLAVPAFIPPEQHEAMTAQAATQNQNH